MKSMIAIESLVRENIRNMKPYSSARNEFSGSADIYLDANENPYKTEYNRYPDPDQRLLKEKISALFGIQPDQLFLGNGSDEAIDLLIRSFCEPNKDSILIVEPTYGMYSVCAEVNGVAVKRASLTGDFELNAKDVLGYANESTKLIILCSPNNPTGNLLDRDQVLKVIRGFNGLVIIDEAYIDFANDTGFVQYLAAYPNLVILRTFSKAWALAGLRLGIAIASKEIIGVLTKIKYPYNINSITQRVALSALQNEKLKNEWVKEIIKERELLKSKLQELKTVSKVFPSNANFLLVRFLDSNFIFSYLIEKKIIVRVRSNVPLCNGCLRITVGTPEENKTLLEALNQL
jgi:histidinol-phosphate aminotransferase